MSTEWKNLLDTPEALVDINTRLPLRRLPLWRSAVAVVGIVGGALLLVPIWWVGIPLLLFGIVFGLNNIVDRPSRQMLNTTAGRGLWIGLRCRALNPREFLRKQDHFRRELRQTDRQFIKDRAERQQRRGSS